MIYKFHSFELLPWGATLKIEGKSSSKEINTLVKDTHVSSTTWISVKEALGKNRSFFIESKKEPVSITYGVTSKNGDLVDIETNLICTSTKVNGIITEFTLDNTDWFNRLSTTDSILIEKKIQKVKFTLNNTPYSTNQNYLKFYVDNNQIYYNNYTDKTFYFNTSDIINENSNIKAIYNVIDEIEETITSIADSGSTIYGRAYVNKGVSQVISIYNVTKQKEISNISPSYDTQNGQYYFRIRVNTNNFEIGNILNIKYKCYEKAIEEINTVTYGNYGRGYISMTPINSNNSFYNVTKGVNISSSSVYRYYDNTEHKYYYRFTISNTYALGDRVRIIYYYLNEIPETKKAIEDTDSTLHEGTIPSGHTNLIVEECIDSNNYMVLFKRKNSNTISLYNDTYDGKNVIVKYEKEKPYVRLCCNNVKIETMFLNSGAGYSNDFRSLTYDDTYLYPTGTAKISNIKGKLLRYITIHWNKVQEQQVYFGESFIDSSLGHNDSHYMFLGGSDEYEKIGNGVHEHSITSYKITPPKINSLSKPYYSVGYVVNFQGENWTPGSSRYINSPFTYYTENGYIKSITTGIEYNISGLPIPSVTTLEKWGNQLSFYKSNDYYVSPSDGLQLYTKWDTCSDYDPCDGGGDGCCHEPTPTTVKVNLSEYVLWENFDKTSVVPYNIIVSDMSAVSATILGHTEDDKMYEIYIDCDYYDKSTYIGHGISGWVDKNAITF